MKARTPPDEGGFDGASIFQHRRTHGWVARGVQGVSAARRRRWTDMIKIIGVFLLVTVGCAASATSSAGPSGSMNDAPCGPRDCGPEPPIAPCPGGAATSSVCRRGAGARCERHVLCDGRERDAVTQVARDGETCGGAAVAPATPATCAPGLVCRNDANDPTFPGTCSKP
jgi:hypothetical protein